MKLLLNLSKHLHRNAVAYKKAGPQKNKRLIWKWCKVSRELSRKYINSGQKVDASMFNALAPGYIGF